MERETSGDRGLGYSVALTATALVLHYAWENLQCSQFVHRQGDTTMWLAMVWATLGDVGLTWIAQFSLATLSARWIWPREARRTSWLVLVVMAAAMAVALERYALATGRWSYAATNPQIPGVGVSLLPVAQLMILFPASFVMACRFAAQPPGTPRTHPGSDDRAQDRHV